MPYRGPRVEPWGGPDPGRLVERISGAFQRIEERPDRMLKRAVTRARAARLGIRGGGIEETTETPEGSEANRPEAPNRDRTRGSGVSGRGRPSATDAARALGMAMGPPRSEEGRMVRGPATPETRRESEVERPVSTPESRARAGRFELPGDTGTDAMHRRAGGGPDNLVAGLDAGLEQDQDRTRETAGLPPGDVRAPTGTRGRPGRGEGDPETSRGPGRGEKPSHREPSRLPPERTYNLGDGYTYEGDRDLGGTIAAAFGGGERARAMGESIEQEPRLYRLFARAYGMGDDYDSRYDRMQDIEVTPSMVRSMPAPQRVKDAAMEAIESGYQGAAQNIWAKWGGRRREGSTSVPEATEHRGVNAAIRLMRSGQADSFAEAASMVGRAPEQGGVGYEPSVHDVADAAKAQLGPERAVYEVYGTPNAGSEPQMYVADMRTQGYSASQILRAMRKSDEWSDAEVDEAEGYLSVDPTEIYIRQIMHGSLGGQGGGR